MNKLPVFPATATVTSRSDLRLVDLIDWHVQSARAAIGGARHARTSEWRTPVDVQQCLCEAALWRRAVAVLLAYQRAGVTQLPEQRWLRLWPGIVDVVPAQPLQVVTLGSRPVGANRPEYYPLLLDGACVGDVSRLTHASTWGAYRRNGCLLTGRRYLSFEEAAYAAGFLIAW